MLKSERLPFEHRANIKWPVYFLLDMEKCTCYLSVKGQIKLLWFPGHLFNTKIELRNRFATLKQLTMQTLYSHDPVIFIQIEMQFFGKVFAELQANFEIFCSTLIIYSVNLFETLLYKNNLSGMFLKPCGNVSNTVLEPLWYIEQRFCNYLLSFYILL